MIRILTLAAALMISPLALSPAFSQSGSDDMPMARMMGGGCPMMGMMGRGMMDRDMMGMMMPDGNPENMAPHMAVKMQEFDADSDGALTLEEFEALHTNAVRDRMVDRFQHLDADGNGQISQDEMEDAGTRMSKMNGTSIGTDMEGHHDSE